MCQEYALSSRVLHWTEHELLFECAELPVSESYPDGIPFGDDDNEDDDNEDDDNEDDDEDVNDDDDCDDDDLPVGLGRRQSHMKLGTMLKES